MTRKKGLEPAAPVVDNPLAMKIILPPKITKSLQDLGATEIEAGDQSDYRRPEHPHLSFSQLSTYMRCSMQYWFSYIEKVKSKPTFSLAIGSGGHEALEKATKRKIKTGETSSPDEVVDWASSFMDKQLNKVPLSEYEKDIEPGAAKDKFLAATRIFQTRDAPKIIPIHAEMEFNLDLNEFLPEPAEEPIKIVNGKIDLVYDDLGTKYAEPDVFRIGVDDYKYTGRKKQQTEVDLSPQLSLYATALKKATGKWPSRLGFRQITSGTVKDGPDAIHLTRSPELMSPDVLASRMRRLAHQFSRVSEGIRRGVFIPTDNPMTCSWCGYRDRCQSSLVTDLEAATLRQSTTPQG